MQRREGMSKVVVPPKIEALASATVNAALTVHRALGPGLLESAYHECLAIELSLAGLQVQREQTLPLTYRGQVIQNAYRLDLLVNFNVPLIKDGISRVLNLDFQNPLSGANPDDAGLQSAPFAPTFAASRLRA